jgi:hypothetical protein
MTDARLAAGEESDASAAKVYRQIVSLMNQLLRQLGLIAQSPTPIPRRRHGREPATLEEYQAALEGGEIDPDPVNGLTPGDDRETDGGGPWGVSTMRYATMTTRKSTSSRAINRLGLNRTLAAMP